MGEWITESVLCWSGWGISWPRRRKQGERGDFHCPSLQRRNCQSTTLLISLRRAGGRWWLVLKHPSDPVGKQTCHWWTVEIRQFQCSLCRTTVDRDRWRVGWQSLCLFMVNGSVICTFRWHIWFSTDTTSQRTWTSHCSTLPLEGWTCLCHMAWMSQ